ncbi:MAG TPA: hypothetical protein VL992_17585 [Tepidisphaeraceae bacterium]|nr:hypothetical protein [Tepidisphaeraceae bacterium]
MKTSFSIPAALLAILSCSAALAQVQVNGTDANFLAGGPAFVVSSAVDHRGNVWLGTEDDGLWRVGPDGQQRFFPPGDDTICSLAVDSLGRVWAGEDSGGVAIFDGQTLHQYDVTQGPGGGHISAIATCPTDGDVWLATENGLTRYSLKNGTWSYYDRSTGMPDVQISGIAFDSTGRIFVALLCRGITMAGPADNYATWTTVTGPDEMPAARSGTGLPSPLINAIAVDKDDSIYAGTANGLAWSTDHGKTWQFLRGRDWANLAAGSYDGAPPGLQVGAPTLQEDWITCLSTADPGELFVGYRSRGYQVINLPSMNLGPFGAGSARTLCALPDGGLLIGTYGRGTIHSALAYTGPGLPQAPQNLPPPSAIPVPAPAAAPTEEELNAMTQQVEAFTPSTADVQVLSDDWATRGDWVGRYGRQFAMLCGLSQSPTVTHPGFDVGFLDGPYRTNAQVYFWQETLRNRNLKAVLYDPERSARAYGEINDSGANSPQTPMVVEGPDLYVKLTVPAGVHRVSLYFSNIDGHAGRNVYNDYYIQVKGPHASGDLTKTPAPSLVDDNGIYQYDYGGGEPVISGAAFDTIGAELSPTIARLRVPDNWEGVYKRMLMRGPATYWIKIARNHSCTTKIQAVFADDDTPPSADLGIPQLPHVDVPIAPSDIVTNSLGGAAIRLWTALDAATGKQGYAECAARMRIAAYRAAAAAGADQKLLESWRWQMPIWLGVDHYQLDRELRISGPRKGQ